MIGFDFLNGTIDTDFFLIFLVLQNFQDLEAEKAIMGSIVYCIHHKDGCKWSDELRKLKVILYIYFFLLVSILHFYIAGLMIVKIIEKLCEQRRNPLLNYYETFTHFVNM